MSAHINHSLPPGTSVPNHVAIVLDGNRRWARAKGFATNEGHKAGYKAMKAVSKASRDFGVHTFTIWGFSTENWERPPQETANIMNLIRVFLRDFRREANKDQIRFIHLGRKDRLPQDIIHTITSLENYTKDFKKHVLNVALDYGGQDEITRAVKKIISDNIPPEKIDENLISSYLDTASQPYPYPDLFIRTSGEQRTSGLLPWQMAYTEFYWEPDHLPDFTPEKLKEAILDYSRRRRRFGGNDIVKHLNFEPRLAAKFELAWWRHELQPKDNHFLHLAVSHLKEQYGLSKSLATEAAKLMAEALFAGKSENWPKASGKLKKFYQIIKKELKLAFEPSLVASLEMELWQKSQKPAEPNILTNIEELARKLYAELYRISTLQASKVAHLRALATIERDLALADNHDKLHWQKAQDYLEKFYTALKDKVA